MEVDAEVIGEFDDGSAEEDGIPGGMRVENNGAASEPAEEQVGRFVDGMLAEAVRIEQKGKGFRPLERQCVEGSESQGRLAGCNGKLSDAGGNIGDELVAVDEAGQFDAIGE